MNDAPVPVHLVRDAMRLLLQCLLGFGVLASTTACSSATAPACAASCDGALVVFGRVSVSWSDAAVPGATVTVELFGDTTRTLGDCAGTTPLAVSTQPLDTDGRYRLPLVVPDAAGRWACVRVTGDPHNWASDVGRNRASGGVIQLHAAPGGNPPDSLRVDLHYSELA